MLKKSKKATATIELYDWSLTAEGVLGQPHKWTITNQASEKLFGNFATSRTWTEDLYFWDEDELEEWLWEELIRITKKYHHCSVEVEEVDVECCDECEEPKDDCYC